MNNYTERDTVTREQIERWFKLGKNVLLLGDHGVGKTTIIKSAWDSMGLKSAFFSGATLDPWVDLIGIPKLVKIGGNSVIEFARPQTIDESLEAIFIDEYNRSQPAVRNAVLELMQFKSMNGRKFPNLKVVWAAGNPADTDRNYDVEEIDPAQEDRFHVIVKLSGKPDLNYFLNKYGKESGEGGVKWYNNLAPEIKKLISPRRLDYAMEYVLFEDGEARDIFPDKTINVSQFTKSVRKNEKFAELLLLSSSKNEEGLAQFFKSQKNVQPCLKDILKDFELAKLFIKYGDTEEVVAFANSDSAFSLLVHQAAITNSRVADAVTAHRAVHNQCPVWFDNANRVSISSKSALEYFLEYKGEFINSKTDLRIGDILPLLNFKDPTEIVDEINCLESAALYDLDEESAQNILNFFSRIDLKDLSDKSDGSNWVKKAYSLIYSAFNFFYLRDANLIGASFACKGCERIATAPPFLFKGEGAGGSRGRNGRLSIREEAL